MNVAYEHKPAMTFIGFSVRKRATRSVPCFETGSMHRSMPGSLQSPDYECGI